MMNLGLVYHQGQGVPQSYERAAELYKQGAALGDPVSQRDQAHFQVQIFKQTSRAFTHNPPLHIRNSQFTKRMNSQLQPQTAMSNLGTLYAQSQGVPQSYERAAELYKQSAAQGNAVSQSDQAQFHHAILSIF